MKVFGILYSVVAAGTRYQSFKRDFLRLKRTACSYGTDLTWEENHFISRADAVPEYSGLDIFFSGIKPRAALTPDSRIHRKFVRHSVSRGSGCLLINCRETGFRKAEEHNQITENTVKTIM
ncbi:hypothetical protein FY557_09080 [Chryseobacterium sp. SN22]|uniref:hypothetical protein n=1 Tax=Chryseobacterium sp. SN22 TaxID=2606431 RepID=UPI0011ED336F|nr:hypothetical protein [Chryseobacterium sp. SN22]KAA0128407.1 hypothetical protein FY557_09080 [Chryseobacterium sp. SN22]